MNKTTLENWEAEFDDEFTYFDENGGQYILGGYDEKTRLNTDCIPEIKNFIKDLLASSQKDKEKAVEEERAKLEPIIEVARAIADGSAFSKENGLIWQHWIDEAKKRVESLKSKKE